jgi:putative transposase
MAFIDEQRCKGRAVESVCRVLRSRGCEVAARTYRAWKAGHRVAARTFSDAVLMDAIVATAGTPEGLYGRRKMTAYLRRQGHHVSGGTVDRLMSVLGRNGVRRGKKVRTTIPTVGIERAPDLLKRDFTAPAPNRVWVADFTYCRSWAGFVYAPSSSTCTPNGSWPGTHRPTNAPSWSWPRSGSRCGTENGKDTT